MTDSSGNTHFHLLDRHLSLVRYPLSAQQKSLQAWDAADEYMIEHVEQHYPDYTQMKMAIFNDAFGALATWFDQNKRCWQTDSWVAELACKHNLSANGCTLDNIEFVPAHRALPEQVELVLIKIPKTLALLEQQLINLQGKVTARTIVVAAGKAKDIHNSTLALFNKHLGTTKTSLAKKKARLVFTQVDQSLQSQSPYPTIWRTESPDFTIHNLANVFSRQSLDIGARFLLQHLPNSSGKNVADLGCGNGILGLTLLNQDQDNRVLFADESYMAIESARINVSQNLVSNKLAEKVNQATFLVSDSLSQIGDTDLAHQLDLVLCNPPFHQNNTITDHIAWQMFQDAKQHLRVGGELRIVGNRHLDYANKLKRLFGGCQVIAANKKFVILSAQKR